MRRALWYGTGTPPPWLNTLLLAERWHMYPGDLATRPGALRWAARQALVDDLREQDAKVRAKLAARTQGR